MNDRFKFRAWDRINNKWLNNKNCIEIGTGYLTDFYDVEQAFNRRYVLMQCTGLKDKNGTLIYEGDVVKMPFVEPILNYMPSDKNTEFAKIEEFKGCFTIFYLDKSQRTYLYQWNNQIEVIGNIYESPDLLESEDNQ